MIKLIKFEEWMFLLLRLQKNDKDGLTILKQFGLPLKIKVLILKGNILITFS
jgi:hypothetical protein